MLSFESFDQLLGSARNEYYNKRYLDAVKSYQLLLEKLGGSFKNASIQDKMRLDILYKECMEEYEYAKRQYNTMSDQQGLFDDDLQLIENENRIQGVINAILSYTFKHFWSQLEFCVAFINPVYWICKFLVIFNVYTKTQIEESFRQFKEFDEKYFVTKIASIVVQVPLAVLFLFFKYFFVGLFMMVKFIILQTHHLQNHKALSSLKAEGDPTDSSLHLTPTTSPLEKKDSPGDKDK